MRALWIAGAVLGGLITVSVADAQQRLPSNCWREIRELCGPDHSQISSCLLEKRGELSETCADEVRERMRQQRVDQLDKSGRLAPQNFDLVSYGDHWRQGVDFYRAQGGAEAPPLVLFLHGGGWAMGDRTRASHAKPEYFTEQGFAYASAGYRVLPDAPVEDQAKDVAAAISKLRSNAADLGFDPDTILLIGHSAGAHLAALIATDPSYAGEDMAAIKGVILLDGAGYDVPATMAARDAAASRFYLAAFGTGIERQTALSPIAHVGGADVPNWLILHVSDREQSRIQSQALAAKLSATGAIAEVVAVTDTNHGKLNRDLGKDGDSATAVVDDFLRDLIQR